MSRLGDYLRQADIPPRHAAAVLADDDRGQAWRDKALGLIARLGQGGIVCLHGSRGGGKTQKAAQMAKHTDSGVRFEIGGVEVEHDKVLAHLKSKYPFLVDASGITGGGASNNNSGGGAADTNPFAKGSFNLTEQARISRDNPQLAAQLKQAASR